MNFQQESKRLEFNGYNTEVLFKILQTSAILNYNITVLNDG